MPENKGLPSLYSSFIHLSRYARWREEDNRRETWDETVDRYVNFMCDVACKDKIPDDVRAEIRRSIYNIEVMPSMRAMMTAGKALEQDEIACFNCTMLAIDHPFAFDEMLYLLACGCGTGISVERQFIVNLPVVAEKLRPSKTVIKVEDSRIGWANALRELIGMLYQGRIPEWDISLVRPSGARLKTFGGRACLTGDTLVYTDSRVDSKMCSIEELFGLYSSTGTKNSFSRSLDEASGLFFWNKVLDVVDNGMVPVYSVVTESGISIKATENHRFMNVSGLYSVLSDFRVDDMIAVEKEGKLEYDRIVSIDSIGPERVFDLVMQGPNHNFVANRFVSHNSGPGPLVDLFKFLVETFKNAEGRKLTSVECHDICCKISETIVCGGVRRCLPEGSIIHTSRGGVPIESVVAGDMVQTSKGFYPVLNSGYSGEKQTVLLKHDCGYFECTPEHKVAVLTGFGKYEFKEAGKIVNGDRLVRLNGDLGGGLDTKFPSLYGVVVTGVEVGRIVKTYDIEVKDMNEFVAEGFLVHNSAILSLSNPSDDRMRYAKSGNWYEATPWRAMANISSCFTEKPGMDVFMAEWHSLYMSKSGERGIFNRKAAKLQAEKYGRRNPDQEFLTNPCVVGDTWVLTSDGPQMVCDLIGKTFNAIVNGVPYLCEGGFFSTGKKMVYDVETSRGFSLMATGNHPVLVEKSYGNFEWINVVDLKVGDKIVVNNDYISTTNKTSLVVSVKTYRDEDVYDCVVNEAHCFGANGLIVHNCSEVVARSHSVCNLTEAVVRPEDTIETLKKKVEIATIMGTMQSTLTNFRYLRKSWRENAEEERLLGVSLSGIMDNDLTSGRKGKRELADALDLLREHVVKVNKKWSKILGISQSVATSCVKPSGCTTMDTKIKTNKGVMSMSEIFDTNGVLLDNLVDGLWIDPIKELFVFDENNDQQIITRLFVNGHDEVYKIVDEDGSVYKFTSNHKLKTKDGWKRVDDLTENDDIDGFSEDCVVKKVKSISKLYGVELTVDVEVANTHSYQLSNGWVSHNTVSALVNCASGIHPRFSKFFIRRVRADKKDPLAKMMIDAGFPYEDDVTKPDHQYVFSFPTKSPENAVVTDDVSAIDQLELWKSYQTHWAEHKVSMTVYVGESEWMDVGAWVYKNFDIMSGVAFLPRLGHIYKQTPFEAISEVEYNRLLEAMPKGVDWSKLGEYEKEDQTVNAKELACSSGACEIH